MTTDAGKDSEHFGDFVHATGTQLYRQALLLTGDHHLAEDLTRRRTHPIPTRPPAAPAAGRRRPHRGDRIMNDTSLATALHDRVRDEHPDLDRLVRSATRSGTRIRRRRHAVVTSATAAGVAAVAIGVAMLGGSDIRSGGEPDLAVQPTASASHPTDQPPLTRPERAHARALRALQDAPVYVDSPDWRCDQPLDEKFVCTRGASSVVVVWRPAETWEDYQDVAKAGPETFVSDVHGQFFATVNAGLDTTHAQVVEVGAALIWAE